MRGEPREDGSFGPADSWNKLRQWDASRHRAFEELCFQLRESAPEGYKTIKTGNPDGGVEWYSVGVDLRVLGFQAKFVDTVDRLLPLAKESLTTVAANRRHRNVVELTFYAPFDMPDQAPVVRKKSKRPIKSARQRWDDAKARWRTEMVGADDIEVHFVGGGELLERLTLPGNEGRYWFFFNELFLGPEWCSQQLRRTITAANDRYTPQNNVVLPLALVFEGLTLANGYRRRLSDRAVAMRQQTQEATGLLERWVDSYASEAQDVWYTTTQEPLDREISTLRELTVLCAQHVEQISTTLSDLLPDTELPLSDLALIANELDDLIGAYFGLP